MHLLGGVVGLDFSLENLEECIPIFEVGVEGLASREVDDVIDGVENHAKSIGVEGTVVGSLWRLADVEAAEEPELADKGLLRCILLEPLIDILHLTLSANSKVELSTAPDEWNLGGLHLDRERRQIGLDCL